MKIIEKKRVTKEFVAAYECDCCKIRFDDPMDIQEMVSLDGVGGFTSIFGDGEIWSIEMCQHCFKERLGDVIQFHGNSNF